MLLVSWNVAGRKTRLDEQAARVLALEPDLVCLQEVTPVTAEAWLERLAAAGLHGALAPLPKAREGSRPLAALTAARGELDVISVADVPWPERVLAARAGGIEIVNVHSPISPKPGLAKVLTHEAVFRHLRDGSGPRVVLGDLNTPRKELPDGSVWTFARDRYGRLRPAPTWRAYFPSMGQKRRALDRRSNGADPRPRAEPWPFLRGCIRSDGCVFVNRTGPSRTSPTSPAIDQCRSANCSWTRPTGSESSTARIRGTYGSTGGPARPRGNVV